jgi:hypothetical protein
VKARVLDEEQQNKFVKPGNKLVRSQIEVYNFIRGDDSSKVEKQ